MSLNSFIETTNPDNRIKLLEEERPYEIVIGADCTHVFELDFLYSALVETAEILYRQGLTNTIVFSSYSQNVSIIEDSASGNSYITVHLTPVDTKLFRDSILNTFTQLKLTLKDNSTIYTDKQKVIIKKPIQPLLQD